MEPTELPQGIAGNIRPDAAGAVPWLSALPAHDGYSSSTGGAVVEITAHGPAAPIATITYTATDTVTVGAQPKDLLHVVIGQHRQRVVVNDAPPDHIAGVSPFAAHAPREVCLPGTF